MTTPCEQEAEDYGEFMDGHNGKSGKAHAIEYYKTFCETQNVLDDSLTPD